jgi:hypothetical protein
MAKSQQIESPVKTDLKDNGEIFGSALMIECHPLDQ